MRPFLTLLLIGILGAVPGCKPQQQGAIKAVVIGPEATIRDPAAGPLTAADAVLLQNVAQGLVRFDAAGNIVSGLAERWNVSDDGLAYIFRLASVQWPDGKKVTAEQVARILKRELGNRSRNQLKDTVGAVEDVVAMTDRVVEIQLVAPRPNLLALLAQPEMAILRGTAGTGPYRATRVDASGELRLSRAVPEGDDEETRQEQVLLASAAAADAVSGFAASKSDLVLGGTFADLPLTRRVKLAGSALRFDPASGLFGLLPVRAGTQLDKPEVRHLLSEALDRPNFVNALGVPGLVARPTLLEAGLDGVPSVLTPAWFTTPFTDRLTALRATADRLFGKDKPSFSVSLPNGPGSTMLLQELRRDWGALGLTVNLAEDPFTADLVLIDEVAPSSSPAWFVRRFRCGAVAICDPEADKLMEAGRLMPVPAQRYALLVQAAARIDDGQLFIPITAPVRWSLVSDRVQGFTGNRYARRTLTELEQQSGRN